MNVSLLKPGILMINRRTPDAENKQIDHCCFKFLSSDLIRLLSHVVFTAAYKMWSCISNALFFSCKHIRYQLVFVLCPVFFSISRHE